LTLDGHCNDNYNQEEDDEFFVLVDGEEVIIKEIVTTSQKRTLSISFDENTEKIEIIKTCLT
jgi:hypothetical protein